MLAELSIKKYLKKAAEGTAVPGGGSVAALNASLAASLTEMVVNLTIGKKGYEHVDEEMKAIASEVAELRKKATAAIDRDAEAYGDVMAAFKLPKTTTDEIDLRNEQIEQAFKHAALVPLEVARNALKVM